MSGDRLAVCATAELPPGERRTVEVDRADGDSVSICVLNVGGELFGIGARCRHRGGPICKGELTSRERATDPDHVLACPWHGWEYDLRTGEHLGPPDASLPTYAVTVEGDMVYLEIDSDEADHGVDEDDERQL